MASASTYAIPNFILCARFTPQTSLHKTRTLYIFPVLLMCLPYKLNITNLSTNQRGCRLQTSPECYSMSDTCNLNIKLKNRRKESLLWYTYSMQKCIIQYTKHTNIVKLMASTQTIKTHRHIIIQYSTLLSLH